MKKPFSAQANYLWRYIKDSSEEKAREETRTSLEAAHNHGRQLLAAEIKLLINSKQEEGYDGESIISILKKDFFNN